MRSRGRFFRLEARRLYCLLGIGVPLAGLVAICLVNLISQGPDVHMAKVQQDALTILAKGDLDRFQAHLASLPAEDQVIVIGQQAGMKNEVPKEVIATYAGSGSSNVRSSVGYYISRLELNEYKDIAIEFMRDPDPKVRLGSLDSFTLQFKESRPILTEMAHFDSDKRCRETASNILSGMAHFEPQ